MKFWDASAIVPLLVAEPQTKQLQSMAAKDSAMLVWWGSGVECHTALARRERDGALDRRSVAHALQPLAQLADACHEIDPADAIREAAIRFLRIHSLRAADALRLAAAFVVRNGGLRPSKWSHLTTGLLRGPVGKDLRCSDLGTAARAPLRIVTNQRCLLPGTVILCNHEEYHHFCGR